MKKFLALTIAMLMTASMAACGGSGAASSAPAASSEAAPASSAAASETASAGEDGKFELALITDIGTIDDKSFNQGAWEGLKKYAEEKNISHKYYKPTEKSNDAYLSAIELAVKGGAKVIVTPGFLFEEPVYIAQDQYPDVKFILIDGNPHDADYNYKTGDNTVGITYAEEQAGFLAGYAAVKEGNTKLGFLGGMAVPAVVRFGYGFVQGADYAAKELNVPEISMNYHYTGGFDATPEAQTLAASWYQSGTEVIFACGGAVGNSAMAAAEQANGKVIGVDVDQSPESQTVITSAMKGLGASVYTIVSQFYDDKFPGGQNLVFDATNEGVALPMDTSKFEKFTQADYDKLYAALVADTDGIASNIMKDTEKQVTDIATTAVKVTVVE
ncbi:BMP family ABC transporter substrate-binding protein [Marasmitruncus massiliensis]|jgi:basic membrane protein A|uniref:BMP family ABC transporter substrate-binding protein n=1 Tax=Marasmitruncus massiliensis TaxID=1944642 RepID=UPI000C7D518B|nr:BMP family ABC transporter substrate-binding protein [Oscillospiraceae bacterium]